MDGKNFTALYNKQIDIVDAKNTTIKKFNIENIENSYRYLKIIANKIGNVPEWHIGSTYNGKGWIFVDEIKIKYN